MSGSWGATGHWGRPRCSAVSNQIAAKQKALLADKLWAVGRRVELWLPVEADDGIECTCLKATRSASDFRCLSCYGTGRVPGYRRFMHDTLWASSAEYAGFTLTGVVLDTSIKPHRLKLSTGGLTGTITTPPQAFSNPRETDWETQVAAYRKVATDVIEAEFNTGGGWVDIADINGPQKPTGTGTIQFRVTMTRSSASTESPDFEILRIRRRKPEALTAIAREASLEAGQILIVRTQVVEQALRSATMGRQAEWGNDSSWTVDLALFDQERAVNSREGLLRDSDAGPHPFFEHASGVSQGERIVVTQIAHDDNEFDVLTWQSWTERRAQPGEIYRALVW